MTTSASDIEDAVAAHYGHAGLLDTILSGVSAAGGDPERPTIMDLSAVDEFHTCGRIGTLQALELLEPKSGMHVLDAGCGLGGPARVLAGEFGCQVTGIDLTPDYIATAQDLTARAGLSDRCTFQVGSVTALPYADQSFEAALTFHVGMNIADRGQFYREVFRVLKPGGKFCVFDVMKGPEAGLPFPMPWADSEATSFVKTRNETVRLLEQAGFTLTGERNLLAVARRYYEDAFAAVESADGPPPLGLHLLTGRDTEAKFANVKSAYDRHQTEPVILVARKN